MSDSGPNSAFGQIKNLFPITPFVVGPSGQAGYQTVQSALNAANTAGGGMIWVQPGTYTENLTLYTNTQIIGAVGFSDAGGGATIIGTHTPPLTGGFVFRNLILQSSTNIFSSNSAGSAHLIIGDAAIFVTNGYTFNLPNWTGKLETFDVNGRGSTNDGYVNNTSGAEVAIFTAAVGSGTLNPMIVSGLCTIFSGAVGCPINFTTGSNAFLEFNAHLNPITFANNSTGEIIGCEIDTNIVMSSTGNWTLGQCIINTSSAAITGAGVGTLNLTDISFINNSSISGAFITTIGTTSIFGEVRAGGDAGGMAGCTSITKTNSQTIGAGTGTIKMSTGNNANNSMWIKIYVGTTPFWIPAWTTNAP